MTSTDGELPLELQAALEDLRRIREVVDAAGANHPLRLILRPVMLFVVFYGVGITVFGIAAQQIVDRGEPVMGLTPAEAVWGLGALCLIIGSLGKSIVFAMYSRRAGFNLNQFMRRVFTPGYLRVIVAVTTLTVVSCVGLALNGAESMLLGVITVGIGAIWMIASTVMPLRELFWFGLIYIVLGTLATFLLPEWTFYKLAAIWGGTLVLVGGTLYRYSPAVPTRRGAQQE